MLIGWLFVLRIYVALALFQPYHDLEAGDNQSLKLQRRDRESYPILLREALAPQAKSLTTAPLLVPKLISVTSGKFGHSSISKNVSTGLMQLHRCNDESLISLYQQQSFRAAFKNVHV